MGATTIQLKFDPENHSIKATPTVWPCKAWKLPRNVVAKLPSVLSEDYEKFDICGVYLLISSKSVYVGEAEQVITRFKQHHARPPFDWDIAIAFVSKEQSLEKSHIKYLEHEIYQLLKAGGNCDIKNTSTPTRSHVSDEETMQFYLENIVHLTEVLGFERLFLLPRNDNSAEDIDKKALIPNAVNNETEQINLNVAERNFPFKIGRVMTFAFRKALADGLLNDDLEFLQSPEASKQFRTRGYPVILVSKVRPERIQNAFRFAKEPVSLNGKKYWITTQVYKDGLAPLLAYLEQHGMPSAKVIDLCQNGKQEPNTVISASPAPQSCFASFKDYLQKTMCKNSASSYASSFKDLERILISSGIISSPLLEKIHTDVLEKIREYVSTNRDFCQYNKMRHYSLSAAWKKFEEYIDANNGSAKTCRFK